jgi:pimeloyl-ACP methyl ester carboxylesterase
MTPQTATSPTVTETVTSKDGTQIAYRRLGDGPGLVILHGSMSTGHNHMQLAESLAGGFTVYVPDRRGRGASGRYGAAYTERTEAEDLEALLGQTGATNVFGVSVGGIIALQTALEMPAIEKLAVYEPPLFSGREEPLALLRRFDEQMAAGRVAAALATAMQGGHLAPEFVNKLPHRLVAAMTAVMLRRERRKGSGDYVAFGELAPTLHYETRVIAGMSGLQRTVSGIRADVLLLGGSRSSPFLKQALARLEQILPNARRVEVPGLDHSGSWNSDLGGRPEAVATELRRFFLDKPPA